ncbi:hypothetical protein Q9S36_29435 [Microbacterium sp. ARD31]|uniref:hypothetical protein n=1 Tax=Microbacterium sp. ARD31 TaxID=2962576 RepID=UPI0028826AF3|nr:hypothetical protein [Microbacterium sp. ARD31]MDT0184325.1 hypothetical protein [Microbacterium sp. ARD31]
MPTHPETGEWMPAGGFPKLPDGRELRPTIAVAKMLGVTTPRVTQIAKEQDLTVYTATARVNGGAANYYVLEEILDLRWRRENFVRENTANTSPTEFKLKRAKGQDD